MHLRKLTILTGFLGAFFASWAFGLGLGEIKLNSSLNQPLDADIKLLQVRGLVAEDILIELASAEDFERAGVERPFFLQDLKFEIRINGANGPSVKVTSELPVREPFVNFLIEARWPSGRLLREYTVLPDLPVFSERPAQPVQAPTTQAQPAPAPTVQAQPQQPVRPAPVTRPAPAPVVSQPAPAPRPQVAEPAPQQSSQPQPAPAPVRAPDPVRTVSTGASGSQDYSVNEGDTLWEIALEVRPNRGSSVQQTMLAIQRLNPDAFINGNINLLKRGQVLRVPTQNEIQVLDQVAAIDEVKFQNNQWRSGQGSSSAAELEGSSTRSVASDIDQEPRGQLSLAAPGSQTSSSGRSGAGDTSANTEALENELAISLEELDSVRRENTELNDRIADLEEQIDTLDRLIEVSNEEMRTLELAIEMGEAASNELTDTDSEQVEQGIESQSELTAEVDTNLTEDASGVVGTIAGGNTVTEDPVSEPVTAPITAPAAVNPQPSIVDTLMGYMWYIVAGLAIIILAGVAFVMHRRTQAQMAEFDDFDEDDFYDESENTGEQSTYEELEEDVSLDDNFDIGDELEEPTEEVEAPAPTEAETGDAVGEADIYIAYGKYDQAEELLQKAIISEPNNIAARGKLLEVYSETKDIEKFDREYAQLLSFEDSAANDRAAELRALIPGVAAFAGNTEEGGASESLDLGDDNFGLGDPETSVASAPSTEPGDDDLGDLSFDLDDDGDTATESSSEVDSSLDFDLDLDSDEDSLLSGESEQVSADFASLDDELSEDGDGFSLDLESGLDTELDLGGEETESVDDDMELSLDLDLGDGGDTELNLDLDEDDLNISLEDTSVAEQEEVSSDDILSDLEFSAAAITPEATKPETLETASTAGADSDDEFDMDMDSDVDLAALDAEMNALVGDLDDLDDEEIPVAPLVSEAAAEVKEDLGSLDLDSISESINEGANDTSLELDSSASTSDEVDLDIDSTLMENDEVELGQDGGLGDDLNSELDFLADTDEVATKLDLARAYIDMGDSEGAKDILDEVNAEGNEEQKKEAAELLGKIG
ncbi:motility hub landmark protein FimV [Aurantivibrio infirmus]